MNIRPQPHDTDAWTAPPAEAPEPPEGYDSAVEAAIAEGRAQIAAGDGIPLNEVRREFGLD